MCGRPASAKEDVPPSGGKWRRTRGDGDGYIWAKWCTAETGQHAEGGAAEGLKAMPRGGVDKGESSGSVAIREMTSRRMGEGKKADRKVTHAARQEEQRGT